MSDLGYLLAAALSSGPPPTLDNIWQATVQPGADVELLSTSEYARIEQVAERMVGAVRHGWMEAVVEAVAELDNFTVVPIEVEDRSALALIDSKKGGGVFMFRLGKVDAEVILQVPHRYHDRHTGDIARHAFSSARVRGLFFNTAHRGHGKHNDVAHEARSAFSALTAACIAALDQPVFVQLHGFNREHLGVEAIVSAGPTRSTRSRDRVALALAAQGARVARFPEEIDDLGGTLNAQGKVIAGSAAHFVHLEMDGELRERLRSREWARALGISLARLLREENSR